MAILDGTPGPGLAAALAGVDATRCDAEALLDVIGAWHRLISWATAGRAAAVAAFLEKRTRDRPGSQAAESAIGELQLELTLTGYGADRLLELACPLADRLPATFQALEQGLIDEAKARVIARAVEGVLDPPAAREVERRVLPDAPAQTTGQLRRSVERAVIAVDPQAAERRRLRAEAGRRVEIRATDAHTADLVGRDLPADQALAADQRITALARALKNDGDPHSVTFLRAQVFLSLLLGTGPLPAWPPAAEPPTRPHIESLDDDGLDMDDEPDVIDHAGHRPEKPHAGFPGQIHPDQAGHRDGDPFARRADGHAKAGGRSAGAAGAVHVIVPIDTLCGMSHRPGEVPGYGPVPASVARTIAARSTGRDWCYTIVDHTGRAIGHGHTRPRSDQEGYRSLPAEVAAGMQAQAAIDRCRFQTGHPPEANTAHAQGAYRPGDALRHRVEVRDQTCRFPACRRPAQACDLDHTRPYDSGGPTCDCNLAPLCRRHHRLKQLEGWTLTQPEPGELIWVTPAGRRYKVAPDPYPLL